MPPRRAIGTRPATRVRKLNGASTAHQMATAAHQMTTAALYIAEEGERKHEHKHEYGVLESKESEPMLDMLNHAINKLHERIDKIELAAIERQTLLQEQIARASSPSGDLHSSSSAMPDMEMLRKATREIVMELKEEFRGKQGPPGQRGPQGPANAKVIPSVLNHIGLQQIEYMGTGKYAYTTVDGISGEHVIGPKPTAAVGPTIDVAAALATNSENGEDSEDSDTSRPGSPVTVILDHPHKK